MRTIEQVLGLWVTGLLSPEAVTEWAGRQIARLDQPPTELFDLASDGPEVCLKRAEIDFPYRPNPPSYAEGFALRAIAVDLSSDDDVWNLADWAARNCMGEDLADPFVTLGYQLDHYIADCQDVERAKALIRTELPSLRLQCHTLAMPFAESDA